MHRNAKDIALHYIDARMFCTVLALSVCIGNALIVQCGAVWCSALLGALVEMEDVELEEELYDTTGVALELLPAFGDVSKDELEVVVPECPVTEDTPGFENEAEVKDVLEVIGTEDVLLEKLMVPEDMTLGFELALRSRDESDEKGIPEEKTIELALLNAGEEARFDDEEVVAVKVVDVGKDDLS